MTVDEVLAQLAPWIDRHRRTAWRPIVRRGDRGFWGSLFRRDDDRHTAQSRFGGLPWLAADEPWPACGACQREMHFFLQLNLSDLPLELIDKYGEGLLQLFYCAWSDCENQRDAWKPFDTGHLLRIVDVDSEPSRPLRKQGHDLFPHTIIKDWEPVDDLPEGVEHEALGLIYTYDWKNETVVIDCPELDVRLGPLPMEEDQEDRGIAEMIGVCLTGDKLAGWPNWVQCPEYPNCPTCGERMVYVFQVDSEDHIPFMFGDSGTAHITQCPNHRDTFAFGWACC